MSSDEEEHAPKRSGVRGFARYRKKAVNTKQTSYYTGCVNQCFEKLNSHISDELKHALEDEDDVEDDLLLKYTKKKELPSIKSADALFVISDDEDEAENLTKPEIPTEENINTNAIKSPSPPPPPPPADGQKKKRTRNTKQKKQLLNALENYKSNKIEIQKDLECPQEQEVLTIDDEKLITVRVNFRGRVYRYTMLPNDPFSKVIQQISEKEMESEQHVMLVLKDYTLKPTDTPSSVDLKVADFLECHISSGFALNDSYEVEDPNMIELVVQSQGSKHRELVKAHTGKPVSLIIKEYARRLNKDADCLMFVFDGEELSPEQTPLMLEMEDGDILDVKEFLNTDIMHSKKAKLSSQASGEVIHIV